MPQFFCFSAPKNSIIAVLLFIVILMTSTFVLAVSSDEIMPPLTYTSDSTVAIKEDNNNQIGLFDTLLGLAKGTGLLKIIFIIFMSYKLWRNCCCCTDNVKTNDGSSSGTETLPTTETSTTDAGSIEHGSISHQLEQASSMSIKCSWTHPRNGDADAKSIVVQISRE